MDDFAINYRQVKYLMNSRRKEPVTDESVSDDMVCAHCGKPAKVFWNDRKENLGYSEPFFNGMHRECYEADHELKIKQVFERTACIK